MTITKNKALQTVLDKLVDNKKVFGTSFAIKYKGEVWCSSAGNMRNDQAYFIASTTKLFTTAIILNLQSQGKLNLTDKISRYIDASLTKGLHTYKGKDYSGTITIRHLLAHTSGIPDYFQKKGADGKSWEDQLTSGNDRAWTLEEALDHSKSMKPVFAPGTKGKAHYSDANFQLLGKIIENITQQSYASNCKEMIIQILQLKHTYLYQDPEDKRPMHLYFKERELHIPKAMTSFGPDGGIVSTSSDMLIFIEAFFSGQLFPKDYIEGLKQWNKIFFPIRSGIGIHKIKLPWIFNPTGSFPELIGHSGLSGALAYHSPKKDLYIAGTVNQVAHPDISFKTMIKLVQKAMK
ncbi:MAG: beta-lactamase family protein [Chitinophagales bacterium]|nr:beta-lactamase family protein [Chitinophagales bacterium]